MATNPLLFASFLAAGTMASTLAFAEMRGMVYAPAGTPTTLPAAAPPLAAPVAVPVAAPTYDPYSYQAGRYGDYGSYGYGHGSYYGVTHRRARVATRRAVRRGVL